MLYNSTTAASKTTRKARSDGAALVLGLGNTLLGDDGVGIHVVRRLRRSAGSARGVRFLDGGTLSPSLLEAIEKASVLIVVSAAQLDERAGSVRVFREETMDRFLRAGRSRSVHEASLLELLDTARVANRLPSKRAFVGIQPQRMGWGTELSPPVSTGLPLAENHVRSLLARYGDHAAVSNIPSALRAAHPRQPVRAARGA
ncbi:MAG: HyaD/HybD family hydrogenase maturation endopeptidase [Arenicellales bacterium]|jgi:hydrogenase maturation protease